MGGPVEAPSPEPQADLEVSGLGALTCPVGSGILVDMDATPANAPHLPSNFDPMAYVYVGAFDAQPEPGAFFSRAGYTVHIMEDDTQVLAAHPVHAEYLWLRGLLEASSTSLYRDRGRCDHCGAAMRYVVVLRHIPTGDHIAVGETCADTRVASMDRATWQVEALRKAAQAAREAARTRATREANADAAPDLAEWLDAHAEGYLPRTLWEMRRDNQKGFRWTAEQIEAGRQEAAKKDAEDAAYAARKAEREARAIPAPEGKTTVLGTILSVKAQEGDYGITWKMLVDDDRGFRVWSTIPAALYGWVEGAPGGYLRPEDLRGRRVSFSATLAPKAEDPSFAIAKRPTKATLVDGEEG